MLGRTSKKKIVSLAAVVLVPATAALAITGTIESAFAVPPRCHVSAEQGPPPGRPIGQPSNRPVGPPTSKPDGGRRVGQPPGRPVGPPCKSVSPPVSPPVSSHAGQQSGEHKGSRGH